MKTNFTQGLKTKFISFFIFSFAIVNFSVQGQALTISKQAPANVYPGDLIMYQIKYANTSKIVQTDVEVLDNLPAYNFQYTYSPSGVPSPAPPAIATTVSWSKYQLETLASLNYGDGLVSFSGYAGVLGSTLNQQLYGGVEKYNKTSYYLDPRQTPTNTSTSTETAEILNTVKIKSKENTDWVESSPATKTTITQIHTFSINDASGVVKSASSSTYRYIIAIKNTGNVYNKWNLSAQYVPKTGQSKDDLIPSFQVVSANGTPGSNITQTNWVAPGGIELFYLTLTSPNGTNPNQTNYTKVTATSVPFGDAVSKTYETYICGGQCADPSLNLSIYKLDDKDPVQSGDFLTYTVVINNASDNPVTNLRLRETYPDRVDYVSNTSTYAYNSTTAEWTIPSLPSGMTRFQIRVKVKDNTINNTILSNKVELFQGTSTTALKTYTETTRVLSNYDLYVTKSLTKVPGGGDVGTYGDVFEYTLTYGNKGNYQADNVVISDNYDEFFMDIVDNSGNIITGIPAGNGNPQVAGTIEYGNIVWRIPTLAIGATGTLKYRLRIKPKATIGDFPIGTTSINNNVDITASVATTEDKNYYDNRAIAKVYVTNLPDLEVIKTVDKTKVKLNETFTYTITVKNIGDADFANTNPAQQFTVVDYLPSGIDLNSITYTTGGTFDSNAKTITWVNNNPLSKGSSVTYSITCKVVSSDFEGTNLINKVDVNNSVLVEKSKTNNTFTLTSSVYPNYWIGSTDATDGTKWNIASNWVNGHIPAEGKDVVFATVSNYGTSAVNDLYLDINRLIGNLTNQTSGLTKKALVIPTFKTLIVNGVALLTDTSSLVIKSKVGEGNGALLFNNIAANQFVPATVEFDSKSQKVATGVYPREWQYIGAPVRGATPVSVFGTKVTGGKYGPADNVLIRRFSESKNDPSDIGDKWIDIDVNDPLVSFRGYEVVQPARNQTIYKFKGELNVGNFTSGQLGFTPGVYYRGNYITANSYVAPISINKLQPEDFVNLQQTIYLYNTGSRDQWFAKSAYSTTLDPTATPVAGMFYAVPINVANTAKITQIPSLNGFLVRRVVTPDNSIPGDIHFVFNYDRLEKTLANIAATQPMLVKGSSEIPKVKADLDSDTYPLLKIDVINGNTSDRVLLITAPNTTKQFDNGWDGYKFRSETEAQIYAFTENKDRFQISSDNNLDGTILGFYNGGRESMSDYTLNFHYQDMDSVYAVLNLQDLVTGTITEITDGGSYRFSASSTSPESRFRIIGVKTPEKISDLNNPLGIIYHSNSYLTVNNESDLSGTIRIYDVAGKMIKEMKMTTGLNIEQVNLAKGLYIIEAITSENRTSLKVIIK